ncbi:ATPase [Hanamia caeni]|jgi:nicotinamide riboside kinase|uniref:ATPase n=1 Tax=Hanamia caeni TaxID=2294116 RepID=A0A3M9NMB9_9BACT|nr:ATP-binding protein [Hanamia caeni]RNI38804.1 ATPase [Hanamia caeni]
MEAIKKIVIIGPESTGKSTLCEKLAAHYQTLWVPEYAREYLEKHGTDYSYEDLLTIAKGQIELEERISSKFKVQSSKFKVQNPIQNSQSSTLNPQPSTLLFIDTDMYVMKVWAEYVFNNCHNWILNRIAERKYDLYLLCDVDLPWIEDKLREYPDAGIRKKLFYFYKELMTSQSTPWHIISGNYEQRLQNAINAINETFT